MFSWQSSFFLQFILDKYEKEINDEERSKVVRALVSYHSPELMMKFISAKGNIQMLSPTVAYNLYSILIDYCIDVDYQINSFTLIQIIDYLMKMLNLRQLPKLFQKIEPFFFVVFGHTYQKYPDQEIEKIYQALKGISILPLAFFSISPLSQSINKNHKAQKIITNKNQSHTNQNQNIENKNSIASETFSVLINSAESYLSSPRLANIWIESLSAIFRSEARIEFDLLTIYSLCDKISMTHSKSDDKTKSNFQWNSDEMPIYFKAHFFDSLSYFLSPMNSLQIARTHFFRLSDQISNFCTVEDLTSVIQYSRHLIELRKENEVSSFTIDMISEIIFSTVLPHFRKSRKLEESFKEFCELLDPKKLIDFVNTHFTTSSKSAQQYLLSHFPNNEQDIGVLFQMPVNSELLHLYVSSSYSVRLSNLNILNYLVHFFEFADLSDFTFLVPLYELNSYLFCAKVIQYMSICDNFEKMSFLLSFLMDNERHAKLPIVIYSSSAEYDNKVKNLNDSTSIISLDLAFLTVMYKSIQFPNNKFFYCFLDYLRQCKQCSVNNSFSPKTIEQAMNQKFDVGSMSPLKSPLKSPLERTPVRSPRVRRLSIDKQPTPKETAEEQSNETDDVRTHSNLKITVPKRRLSDADSPILSQKNSPYGGNSPFSPLNSSMKKEINQAKNSLVRQSSRDVFSTPRKSTIKRSKFKTKYFDVSNHYSQMGSSLNYCFYIKELISSVKFWDESLLSLMYLKIADGDLHYGVLVSFFTKTFSVVNQIGKIVSSSPKLLKLFFATTLTMNNDFISEVMKYVFYHGDLIHFRIELILHSMLATFSLKKLDDTIFELLKIGFGNKFYDLTCNVISALFKSGINDSQIDASDDLLNNCKLASLNLYGSGYFSKKFNPILSSDPEEVFLIMCENYNNCDPLVFIDAFRSIYKLCYESGKFKLSSEKVVKTVCHSLVESVVLISSDVIDIESVFLSLPSKKDQSFDMSYYDGLKRIFIKELKMKHTKEIGYFLCLKRVSSILSFDEMKPLLSRLFLNICGASNQQKIINETLHILFKNEEPSSIENEAEKLARFLEFADDSLSQRIIQDMFDTINFQDELEKESLFLCFRKLSILHPKALMTARPPLVPQIIQTYSNAVKSDTKKESDLEESDSELEERQAEPLDKYGFMFGQVFSLLAESDLVLFFNQLTLSPKCDFFDHIILDLCRCEDTDFQLFACIENEFSELIDQTINFQFIFQILNTYIQYQPNIQNVDVVDSYPDLIASLLFILFLCVSESFIQNDSDILSMLQKPINRLEILISLPLMPLNNLSSFDRTIEIIPLPLFSNKAILPFISKCTKLMNSSKHHMNLERLIESMIPYFSQNEQVFLRLVSIYVNPKFNFNHSQFKTKVSKILASSKKLLKIINSEDGGGYDGKQILIELFKLAIEKKTFNAALNSAIIIDEVEYYNEFLLNLNDFDLNHKIELNSKFVNCIQKVVKLDGLKNEEIFYDVFSFIQKDIFNCNGFALNILNACLNGYLEKVDLDLLFRKLFFYLVGKNNFELYLQFYANSYKLLAELKPIRPRELEIAFCIVSNLIGINENRVGTVVSDFFGHLFDLHLSKEASAIAKSIVKQYGENHFNVTFPTISINQKDNMYHI